MQEGFKARLLGLGVMVALLVILVPPLLDGEGVRQSQLKLDMPPPPQLPAMEMPSKPVARPWQPKFDGVSTSPPSIASAPAPGVAGSEAQSDSAALGSLDDKGLPRAWTLQLAAFKDEANARTLARRLKGAGYKIYLRRKKDLTRVFVGPEMDRTRLEATQDELKRRLSLEGLIIRFHAD